MADNAKTGPSHFSRASGKDDLPPRRPRGDPDAKKDGEDQFTGALVKLINSVPRHVAKRLLRQVIIMLRLYDDRRCTNYTCINHATQPDGTCGTIACSASDRRNVSKNLANGKEENEETE
jgi:hypothetical protein